MAELFTLRKYRSRHSTSDNGPNVIDVGRVYNELHGKPCSRGPLKTEGMKGMEEIICFLPVFDQVQVIPSSAVTPATTITLYVPRRNRWTAATFCVWNSCRIFLRRVRLGMISFGRTCTRRSYSRSTPSFRWTWTGPVPCSRSTTINRRWARCSACPATRPFSRNTILFERKTVLVFGGYRLTKRRETPCTAIVRREKTTPRHLFESHTETEPGDTRAFRKQFEFFGQSKSVESKLKI